MLTVESFAVGALQPYHRNPRRGVTPRIAESLKARGQYRPIVVNLGTHTGRALEVLAGNHTLAAAVSLGWEHIEATTVDVDDVAAAQIVLADNRLADLGSYDDVALAEVLEAAVDLTGTGYTDADLAALLAGLEEPVGLTDPDDAPEAPAQPISRLGDVWELGPHRLFVGDATATHEVKAALVGFGPIDAVWTDPPYGVNYVGGTGMSILNDGADEAREVALGAFRTIVAVARPGAPVYVAHAEGVRQSFLEAMLAVGIRFRQTLVWVKDSLVLGRADYHFKHEPILEGEVEQDEDSEWDPVAYGFAPGGEGRLGRGGPHWYGDNRSTTVFQVARPKRSAQHPTMKPVELIEQMLRNSCPAGGAVFDPFGGSGSTLIAAHRLRQRAALVELDPKYADVICRRWQEHTGFVPMRAGEPVDFT